MADPGTYEYWQANEQPNAPPANVDSGTYEYWQVGEQPPVYNGVAAGGDAAFAPLSGWGWGWGGS